MCDEGTRCRAACIGHQKRSLHLHEALSVQITADAADNSGTFDKGILHFAVHDQVGVTLTITHVGVSQSMELLRKNLKALAEQCHIGHMDRDLAGLSAEHFAGDADDIADIIFLEILILFLAHVVSGHVALDIALQILHVAEGSLTHDTLGHHTSGDGYGLALQSFKVILDLLAVMCHVKFCNPERILSALLQVCQLLTAYL